MREYECSGYGNAGKGCKAVLGVEIDDLRYYEGVPGDSWGSRDPAVCFKCPVCGTVTDLKSDDYPMGYTKLIKWSSNWYNSMPWEKPVDNF